MTAIIAIGIVRVALKATYFNSGKPGPGVLLLHQCNRQRKVWDGLAQQLAAAGIQVLTLDLRGFGESGGQSAPLGRAVIGGLAAATVATLVALPNVFAIVRAKAARRSKLTPNCAHS